jgi:HD-GYP domain-containing protein (c-di-GMP phosphodiesterase class II)
MHRRDANDKEKKITAFSVAKRLKSRRGEPVRGSQPHEWEILSTVSEKAPEGDQPSELLHWRARSVLGNFYRAIQEGKPFDPKEIHELAASIVDNVLASKAFQPTDLIGQVGQSIFLRAFYYESKAADLVEHALNVAVLSAKLGSLANYPHNDLLRLTFTALLHNVGMFFIPSDILNKQDALTTDEKQVIQKHSELGADFVRKWGENYNTVADVIHQVHERENGQGYPEGLLGNEIHLDAKIIGISDVYVAMSRPRAYREAFLPFDAMQAIIQTMEAQFTPFLFRALLQALSIFPVGSLVRLSSGEIGRVAAANPERPMRPVVEMIFDSRDTPLDPPRTVDLTEEPNFHIKGAIPKESIAHMF